MARSAASGRVPESVNRIVKKINRTSARAEKSEANASRKIVAVKRVLKTTPESLGIVVSLFKAQGVPTYARGEKEYLESIAQSNECFATHRQAGCVVRPRNTVDVQYVVKHAKDWGVPITVKNGGHSFCGSSTAKEGVLMDLRRLNSINIDLKSLRATVQAGTVWGQVYKQLSILKSRGDGYVLNGGRCPAVGVSGFVLGGGLGPWTRSFGMGCDTVIDFTLVTADGKALTVSRNDDPKSPKGQLFWALCGAGHGNFGIIVQVTIDVCKLQNPDKVVSAGLFTWYPHQAPTSLSTDDLMHLMRNFYTHEWTDQMTIDSTWLVDHRRTPEIGIRWTAYYDGNRPAFEAELDQGIKLESLAAKFKSSSTTQVTSSYLYRVVKEQEMEESTDWTPGKGLYSLYESFVPTLNLARMDEFREIVHERLTYFKNNFRNEPAMASCSFIHTGGKAVQKLNKDTAYRWRETKFQEYIIVRWKGLFLSKAMTEFFIDFRARLRPYSVKKNGAYYSFPNNVPADKTNHDHEGAYFGQNKSALQKVKQIWDGDDYFHWDQGVRLPGQGNDEPIDAQAEEDGAWEDEPIDSDLDDYPGRIESA